MVYIIAIIVLAGLAWWYLSAHTNEQLALENQATPSIVAETSAILPTPDSDLSDEAIIQDLAAVDISLNEVASDVVAIDDSMTASRQSAPVLAQ